MFLLKLRSELQNLVKKFQSNEDMNKIQRRNVSKKCRPPWLADVSNSFEVFVFFRNIFKYGQDFTWSSKQFLQASFFLQGLFHEDLEN